MPSHIRSFSQLLRRFRRNRGGSAVVEFALVAPMFFALLFAIIETALMFFASQVLEYGLSTPEELEDLAAAWRDWAATDDAVFVVAHVEVLAHRP